MVRDECFFFFISERIGSHCHQNASTNIVKIENVLPKNGKKYIILSTNDASDTKRLVVIYI